MYGKKVEVDSKNEIVRVSVIIVNWNSGKLLDCCLQHLNAQRYPIRQIIVIDNASTDSSIAGIQDHFPDVEIFCVKKNTGFAAANNLAVQQALDCEWIALLNPDAMPEADWLERLMVAVRVFPEVSFFGGRLLQAKYPDRLDGAGDAYHISGRVWRRGHGLMTDNHYMHVEEIFSPCAAAALYRRDAFESVGGFDEDFFCYFEDIDLGFRLRLAGHHCLLIPDAVAYHVGSATTGGQHGNFAVYHGHRNLVWTYVKNMPGVLFWLMLPLHIALNLVTIAWFSLQGKGSVILRAKWDALCGIPRMWEKRRDIQSHRVASVGEIWKALDKQLLPRWSQIRRMWS